MEFYEENYKLNLYAEKSQQIKFDNLCRFNIVLELEESVNKINNLRLLNFYSIVLFNVVFLYGWLFILKLIIVLIIYIPFFCVYMLVCCKKYK